MTLVNRVQQVYSKVYDLYGRLGVDAARVVALNGQVLPVKILIEQVSPKMMAVFKAAQTNVEIRHDDLILRKIPRYFLDVYDGKTCETVLRKGKYLVDAKLDGSGALVGLPGECFYLDATRSSASVDVYLRMNKQR